MIVGFAIVDISACLLRKRDVFHGHHKTKASAGNRASTFRQQPFVFPSASQPVGGTNAAPPVGVHPACVMKELFPGMSGILPVVWKCYVFPGRFIIFLSASHPVGGINTAPPVGVHPACVMEELFPGMSGILPVVWKCYVFPGRFLIFLSASHPVGGINAALPVGIEPACVTAKQFPRHIRNSVW